MNFNLKYNFGAHFLSLCSILIKHAFRYVWNTKFIVWNVESRPETCERHFIDISGTLIIRFFL